MLFLDAYSDSRSRMFVVVLFVLCVFAAQQGEHSGSAHADLHEGLCPRSAVSVYAESKGNRQTSIFAPTRIVLVQRGSSPGSK